MNSAELRNRFLEFFQAYAHTLKESDSLIPSGDPTVLFTSAGMNQFKDYFLGKRTDLKRAVSCQKCLRTGDLENVGKTPSHHSFFEMLGNFSFGDYFKEEAIGWAWEFLTGTLDYAGKKLSPHQPLCLSLPAEKLWVSIYEEDEEAFKLWRKLGVPENRIKRFGQADNFWPANAPKEGPNGPCGPCSEIYFDPEGKVQGQKSVEVWNLVFTQFDRQPDGSLKPLPKPNIDTGMGLERLARVVQGVETDYETDLFRPIVRAIEERAKSGWATHPDRSKRLAGRWALADHIRAITFLLSEGLLPSNQKQGYVLRLLIREASLRAGTGTLIGGYSSEMVQLFASLVPTVVEVFRESPYHARLEDRAAFVCDMLAAEVRQFQQTLQSGTDRLTSIVGKLRKEKQSVVPGDAAFELYDTYGLPLELTIELANERGLSVDRAGFEQELKAQQERSRSASQFKGGVFVSDELPVRSVIPDLPLRDAQFVGYENLKAEATIRGLWDGNQWVNQAQEGQEVGIVLDRSPFYGEAGGQIGDSGTLDSPQGMAEIQKTTWVDDVLLHQATIRRGKIAVQERACVSVDSERRLKVARSHTAAHLLHWALRKVLGPETVQAGSFVEVERVRFDFSSLKGLQEEQRHQVEELVNNRVRLADEVRTTQMPLEEARRGGALALFGEKYGSVVRVVTIGDYSKELCGGTHLLHTGFLGSFVITQESSIAAGTRRIEALVGESASEHQQKNIRLLHTVAERLGRPSHEVVLGLEDLLAQIKQLERERKNLQMELARVRAPQLVAEGKKIGDVTWIAATITQAPREVLTALSDAIKQSLKTEGIVLLASVEDTHRVSWVMTATRGLMRRVHVGELLKVISAITFGKGGGRADFAQAGGTESSKIPEAIRRGEELIRQIFENKP